MIKLSAHLLLLGCLFVVVPHTVLANYVVTPKVIDVEAESRDLIERTITITNNTNARSRIFPSVNEIAVSETGDITEFKGPTEVDRPTAITSWLEVSRAEINLLPGESTDLPVLIRMNPNAQTGEYHALIGFGHGRTRDDAFSLVQSGKAPTVVVTVRVPDDTIEFIDLGGFFIDKYVTSNNNSAITYTLSNPGDTTVVPSGEIIVYDSNGKEITNINANPDNISVSPGDEIQLTTAMPIDGMIGRHKAFLSLSYGANQTASVYDTTFFYALPWKFLITLFALVAVLAIVLTLYLHRRFEVTGDTDDAHVLDFHFRDGTSDQQEHDIDLKSN